MPNGRIVVGAATVVAIAWSVVVMRYVHPLVPDKLVNLHAGMSGAQYAAAAPSPLDPLVGALITMAIGLVPTLGVLFSGVLLYLVARIHGAATTLSDQNKTILAQVDTASKAATTAAAEAQRARDTASATAASLTAALNKATMDLAENTRITRQASANATGAYDVANKVNAKIEHVTVALAESQHDDSRVRAATVDHIKETTDSTLALVEEQAGKDKPS